MKSVKLRQHCDSRGSLVENTLEKIMLDSRHFFVSKSKPGTVRGNHYHQNKSEWFYVIQGHCELVIEDIKTKKKIKKVIKDADNIIVHIEPKQAHAFKNIGKNELILLALVNETLDQNQPDTYNYILLK